MTDIRGFFGEYRWLSNFWVQEFRVGSLVYQSNEHYFHAMKATCDLDHEYVRESFSPGVAKHRGNRIPLREDWDKVKLHVMRSGLGEKFGQNPDLAQKLLDTGNAYLEETNTWGDTFWGVCRGEGLNHLGKILMELRDLYRMETILG
jgi:ribA/ribD-fused uncharacterized protein